MLDLACFNHIHTVVESIRAETGEAFVRLDIRAQEDDARYFYDTNTIVVSSRVCSDNNPVLERWLILHELGHRTAGVNSSEEQADQFAKKWYGDTAQLVAYFSAGCAKGWRGYCTIAQRWM